MADDKQNGDGRRIVKIYFKYGSEALAKDLAAKIRNQRSHAHLIDQQFFKDETTMVEAHAILIQASAPKARLIGRTYAEYGMQGMEIVFFDDDGNSTEMELVEPEQSLKSLLGGDNEDPEADSGRQGDTPVDTESADGNGSDPASETGRLAVPAGGYPGPGADPSDD